MKSLTARWIVWLLAVVVTLAGFLVSWDLMEQHYRAKQSETTALEGVCTGLEGLGASCEKVSQSKWGTLPFDARTGEPHIPTAQAGLIFFTCVLVWFALVGGISPVRGWAYFPLLVAVILGALGSVFFEVIMWTQMEEIGGWCPLCLIAHIATFLLVPFVLLLWPVSLPPTSTSKGVGTTGEVGETRSTPDDKATAESGEAKPLFASASAPPTQPTTPAHPGTEPARIGPSGWMFLATCFVAFFFVTTQHFYFQMRSASRAVEAHKAYVDYWKERYQQYDRHWQHTYTSWAIAPEVEIDLEGVPIRGPEDAVNTVVIYSDFECSACRRFEEIFKKQILPLAEREGSGGARVAFKHWPISTECNYTSTRNLHPLACKAAVAASAAQQLGGDEAFWEMHDLLFETQKEWKQTGDFVSLAKRIGLDEAAFAEAMQDPALLEQIQASVAEGDQIGMDLLEAGEIDEETREAIKVGSTPAVFINGKRLKSTRHTATWLRIFRQSALNHRRAQLRERRQSSQQNAQPPQPEQPQPDAQPADEARDLETGDETSEAPQ